MFLGIYKIFIIGLVIIFCGTLDSRVSLTIFESIYQKNIVFFSIILEFNPKYIHKLYP